MLRRQAVGRQQRPDARGLRHLLCHEPVRGEGARGVPAAVEVEQHRVGLDTRRDDPLGRNAARHHWLNARPTRQPGGADQSVHAPPAHPRGQRRVGHVAKEPPRDLPPEATLEARSFRRGERRRVSAVRAHVGSSVVPTLVGIAVPAAPIIRGRGLTRARGCTGRAAWSPCAHPRHVPDHFC